MSREKKCIDLCPELIRHYMDALCPTIEKLLTRRQQIKEKYKELRLDGKGYCESTYTRAFDEKKVTPSFAYDLRIILKVITQEAHEDKESGYNSSNLPVLLNLYTIPEVLVPVLDPDHTQQPNGQQLEMEFPNSPAMSRFDLIRELGETIINSELPQILYATIMDGEALKCLMDGLDGAARVKIEKIVVHAWDHFTEPNDFDRAMQYMYEIIERRDLLLQDISHGEGINIQLDIDEYILTDKPSFYALMYGKGTMYCGHCGIRQSIYKEIGSPMYRLTELTGEKYHDMRNLMMYGAKTVPEGEDRQPPFERFPFDYVPYSSLATWVREQRQLIR